MPDPMDFAINLGAAAQMSAEDCDSLTPQINLRPELKILKESKPKSPAALDFLLQGLKIARPLFYKLITCNIEREKGNALYKEAKYPEAIEQYKKAAHIILGENVAFPAKADRMMLERYWKLVWQEQMDLVACCNNLTICYIKMDKLFEAIEWSVESAVLYENQSFNVPTFYWKTTNFNIEEYYTNQQKYHLRLSQTFLKLCNTGCAVHHALAVLCVSGGIHTATTPTQCKKLSAEADLMEIAKYRHPDPNFKGRLAVNYPDLQVRGSWKKCIIPKAKASPPARLGHAAFIWNGGLYIAGGQAAINSRHRDLWVLPLSTMGPWRRLPDFLPPNEGGPLEFATTGLPMRVYRDEAFLFHGTKILNAFNLKTERWRKVNTTFKGGPNKKWPYCHSDNSEHCMEIYNDKMYIFGGQDGRSQLGHNIFMILDLKKMEWEHVCGTSVPTPSHEIPMLRVHAESWILPSLNKMYIMYGNANRMAENLHNPPRPHGAERDYTYEDLWAFDMGTKKWTREIIKGNYPCPRTEFSTTYNTKLDRVVAFGGYSATTETFFPDRRTNFTFAYFADTFIQNPRTHIWQQVLTRGFPTYRAQSRLLSDPATGRIFLVGGYTNSDFVPSKHVISRAFNDIWELLIDIPGGGIDPAWDWREEERTAQMGPWRTCYNCGNVGQWKMCGGTCGGKVLYCSVECGQEGWEEHKSVHGCRNVRKTEAGLGGRKVNGGGPRKK